MLTSASAGTLAQYGLTNGVLPRTYRSDSVWSYELGGKFRLWEGRAQINAAVYDLQWKDVQTFLFLAMGPYSMCRRHAVAARSSRHSCGPSGH